MSILGFYLCKNYEFWFSLWNCYITECLYEYGMSIFFQVHVTNLQDQQRSLIMVTFLALFVQSVPILLTIPMDYHLHGSRAMRGLATLSVPSMPNTTHETERKGQMTRCRKTFQGLPCAVQLNTSSFFFQASPPVCFPQWEASKQTSLWMCTRLKRAEVLKETEGWRAQNAGERTNKTPLLLP